MNVCFHGDIPLGVQDRYSLVAPPEKGVFPSVNMKVEMFGNLVYKALEKV